VPFARPAFERKIRAPQEAGRWAAELPRPLVFTNGVFDLLHRGHVTYLAQARALGASLLVALNGDASAARLGKGPDRPLNALEDRMAVVAALESVDAVTWFDEDTPLALIGVCLPDVLVKGGDYRVDQIVGSDTVLKNGGEVRSLSLKPGRSTTALIEALRRSDDDGVGAAAFPVCEAHLGDFARNRVHAAGVKRAKTAAAAEIGLDDIRSRRRKLRLVSERQHRDRDLVGTAPGDFDGELRVGRTRRPREYP